MAVCLTHFVDAGTHEDAARLLSLLLRLLPVRRVHQSVVLLGHPPAALSIPREIRLQRLGSRLGWQMGFGLDLRRQYVGEHPDVILAWSSRAAAVADAFGRCPTAVTITDPAEADDAGKWWRSAGGPDGRISVVCPAQLIQRRLVEHGIPMEATAVIRPGVDFAAIREAKQSANRAAWGLPEDGPVLLTTSPPSRAAGQFQAVWATAVLRQIWPDIRMILPGRSREQRRLDRLRHSLYCPEVCIFTEDHHSPAELLAVSDVLVAPAARDVGTGWLAWAMAAGVPIVGCAVPSISELIADRHNGLLCKPGEPHTLAARIRMLLRSPDLRAICVETARGQAYDVFRAQRCVAEYLKLIDNLAAGRQALAGIQDAAINA